MNYNWKNPLNTKLLKGRLYFVLLQEKRTNNRVILPMVFDSNKEETLQEFQQIKPLTSYGITINYPSSGAGGWIILAFAEIEPPNIVNSLESVVDHKIAELILEKKK